MLPPAPLRFAFYGSDPSTSSFVTFLIQRGIHIPQMGGQTYDVVFWQRAGRGYDVQSLYEGGGKGTDLSSTSRLRPPSPTQGLWRGCLPHYSSTPPHPPSSVRRPSCIYSFHWTSSVVPNLQPLPPIRGNSPLTRSRLRTALIISLSASLSCLPPQIPIQPSSARSLSSLPGITPAPTPHFLFLCQIRVQRVI
jgi:hypothetical protein